MKIMIAMFAVVLSAQFAQAAQHGTAKCEVVEKMGEESSTTHQLTIELDSERAGEASTPTNVTVLLYFPVEQNGELGEINVSTPFLSGRANTNKIVITDGYQHVSVTCALQN